MRVAKRRSRWQDRFCAPRVSERADAPSTHFFAAREARPSAESRSRRRRWRGRAVGGPVDVPRGRAVALETRHLLVARTFTIGGVPAEHLHLPVAVGHRQPRAAVRRELQVLRAGAARVFRGKDNLEGGFRQDEHLAVLPAHRDVRLRVPRRVADGDGRRRERQGAPPGHRRPRRVPRVHGAGGARGVEPVRVRGVPARRAEGSLVPPRQHARRLALGVQINVPQLAPRRARDDSVRAGHDVDRADPASGQNRVREGDAGTTRFRQNRGSVIFARQRPVTPPTAPTRRRRRP